MAGLFVARVALEAGGRPWPGALVVAVGLLAALGGLALGRWLARRRVRLWSLLWLPVYVLWPQRDLAVAASVTLLVLLIWLLSQERQRLPRWAEPVADGVTFVAALAVYLATAAPDVLPADAGEFQLVAARLGVAHPFGFPLYTLVGHLLVRLLPWGTPAYRLNLVSGLLAAGTLVLVARATRLWARHLGASPFMSQGSGLAAALALGTSTTFWAQATIANIRTPALFFAALALYALARFGTASELPHRDRALVLLGLALGLGGGHYPPLAFIALFFVAYVLLADPRLLLQPRRWWRPLLVGVVSFLLPLAYLPIQGARSAPLAPPGLDTLSGFLHHFLALGFGGDMFAFARGALFPHRVALVTTLFPFQFNAALLAAALVGLVGLLWRDRRLFVLLAGSLVLHTFVTVTYRAPQTVEYLMPAYLPIAIAAGLLPSLLANRKSQISKSANPHSPFSILHSPFPILHSLLCAAVLLAGLLNGYAHGPSFAVLARDASTRQAVAPLLETAPTGALILADWHWATPLWYLQQVEGLRPDVQVDYVWPVAGEEYRDTWLRRAQEACPEADPSSVGEGACSTRPLLLTHFYKFPGYTTEPWEQGFLLRQRPVTQPSAPLVRPPIATTFGEKESDSWSVELLGYSRQQGQYRPGQVAEFVLAWRPAGPLDPPPSFTLRLVDGEGRTLAQADRALDADVAPGEVRFERLALPLYPTLPPGRYRVTLGAYTVSESGFQAMPSTGGEDAVTLTDLELVLPGTRPFTLHRQAVPFSGVTNHESGITNHESGGATLVGVDYDRSVPDALRVYLHWQGPVGSAGQVRVRAADGTQAAASLSPMPAGTYQMVALDLPGDAQGALCLALNGGQGQAQMAAGAWGWAMEEIRLPVPAPNAQFVALGDEMAVIGATAHPAAPGETMAVDVRLVALRPLTTDDATSVRLTDGQGRWLATHDCQPALGAVPTLKWIRGSRVVDRHLLSLPEDLPGGEVRAWLVAYERFRNPVLPPMDGRFSEVPLGSWDLP